MSGTGWHIAAQTHDRLGESALWHPQERALYWIDWYSAVIHRLTPVDGRITSWRVTGAQSVGSLVFAAGNRLLLAADHGVVLFDPATGATAPFTDPNGKRAGLAYNDAKVDRAGRYWVGSFHIAETEPRASFYRIAADGSVATGDSGFIVCNGPAFSPDNSILYFSDTLGRQILAYDLAPATAALSRKRVFATFSEADGLPDGLTVDSAGDVWCAHYGAGCVSRFRPDGTCAEKLALPVANVTSCCLGGDDLKTLYVTTGWSASATAAGEGGDIGGALFARRVSCPGLPEPIFAPGAP